MSYQVLARKWRPRRFAEVVGQQHVLRALINALDHGRMHHAYLFTGTRGVGKTTLARIFAKSLNCEKGVSSTPCGECSACREVDEGRFVDLLEVDAASRTKVEDTRDLLENVPYLPTRGRFKVYLIDEVHMLSGHSFNALLKTLEEPPPHVKFLLATTDPQRLPVTILSRCLQFNLKRLPTDLISGHLRYVLEQEGVEYQPHAVELLARGADGSMRDALSLLDQAIAFGAGALRDDEVRSMLGTIDREYVLNLARALAGNDASAVLTAVALTAEHAPDFEQLLADLLSLLHRVALAQALPGAAAPEDAEAHVIGELAQRLPPEDVQLYYQIGLIGRRDLPLAPDRRSGLEMVLLRMLAFRPAGNSVASETAPPARHASGSAPTVVVAAPGAPSSVPPTAAAPAPAAATPAARAVAAVEVAGDGTLPDWTRLIAGLKLDGLVRQLAANCALAEADERRWVLTLATAHASLHNKKLEERLTQALQAHLGYPVSLEIRVGAAPAGDTPAKSAERETQERMRAAQQAIQEDGNLKVLLDTFEGRIVPNSIQPVD